MMPVNQKRTRGCRICQVAVGVVLLALAFRSAYAGDPPESTSFSHQKFLATYCSRCHTGARAKGEFRSDRLSSAMADKENLAAWRNALRQLAAGTMPPQDERRPKAEEVAALRGWIDRRLVAEGTARPSVQGRAVMRRLNQHEYHNTIRDLLQVSVDLEGILPPDLAPGGFDTDSEGLHFSSYQLDGYLVAADRVLDAALANRRPAIVKRRLDPKAEIATRRTDVYRHLDDGVAVFSSDLASNIQIVFWKFLTRHRGKYRFRISAYAYQSDKPVLFHVNGGTDNLGEPPFLIDYFEVPPGKPTVVEFVEELEAGRNIRLLVDTAVRPRELQRGGGAADYRGPGLVVQWVDVEGPLVESWPPPSYRLLFGDLPQQAVADTPNRREAVSQRPLADARTILGKFARRAFRRAVTDEEVRPYIERVGVQLAQGVSFQEALRVGLKAILISPEFLFLRERARPAGKPDASIAGDLTLLDDFALASRLSYFLWSSMPDERLLQLAEQGQLSEPSVLREQVERMLNDPKAEAFTENFAGQWLGLREIDATLPDRQLYPEYDALLRASMPKEVSLFFEEVLRRDLSLANFVDSDFSMLNGRLAKHYGIPGIEGLPFRKVDLPADSHRGGVMTMAAVLKVTANGTTTSPIVRGAWVLDRILGTPPDAPPAGVEAIEPDIRGATTIREQLSKHRKVATCAACHREIDPPGFALENYDVIGGWRERYRSIGQGEPVVLEGRRMRYRQGPPVDASDVLPDGRSFRDINQYKQLLLADKNQLARALADKLLVYATGTPLTAADRSQIDGIVAAVGERAYGFRALVHEVVQSPLFRSK